MRILYIGVVEFSAQLLEELISLGANVVGVLTKNESRYNADFVDLSTVSSVNGIDHQYFQNINDESTMDFIQRKEPDVIFCFGLSQLIREELINCCPMGVLGYHPAMLPANRGRHPIIWALALGLEVTGSTFFFMDEGADSGKILSQKEVFIDYEDDANTLYLKIIDIASKQLAELVPKLESGTFKLITQDESKANYWRKRTMSDGMIDWRMSSRSIYNLVRALRKPYPGASFSHSGTESKIWRVEEINCDNYVNSEPGKIMKVFDDGTFLVKVGTGCIKVIEYETEIYIKEGMYL